MTSINLLDSFNFIKDKLKKCFNLVWWLQSNKSEGVKQAVVDLKTDLDKGIKLSGQLILFN